MGGVTEGPVPLPGLGLDLLWSTAGEGQQALDEAHKRVIIQEERILRALATAEELKDAGYRPGGSMKAGRLTEAEMAAHRASVLAKRGIHEDGGPA